MKRQYVFVRIFTAFSFVVIYFYELLLPTINKYFYFIALTRLNTRFDANYAWCLNKILLYEKASTHYWGVNAIVFH